MKYLRGVNKEVIATMFPPLNPNLQGDMGTEQFRDLHEHLKIMSAYSERMMTTAAALKRINEYVPNEREKSLHRNAHGGLAGHPEGQLYEHMYKDHKDATLYFLKKMCVQLSEKLQPWHDVYNPIQSQLK